MVLSRSSSRVAAGLLAAAAVVSACSLGEGWNAGFHPFALLAALLPLQLAALLWCLQASPTAAAPRSSGMRPPASD
jgi:hypothetical protein